MRNLLAVVAAFAIAGCDSDESAEPVATDDGGAGSYTLDAATGRASGSIDTADGTVKFVSGPGTPVDLPDGFTIYPDAEVVTNTSVGRGNGKGAIVALVSEDDAEDLVSFYRAQAEAAGVAIETELKTAHGTMIGGKSEGGLSFSFNANRVADGTKAELSVSKGL